MDTTLFDRFLKQIRKKRGTETDPCCTTVEILKKLNDIAYFFSFNG